MERLEALAAMQEKILVHALGFYTARAVVYSTCSVHHIENEGVVGRVLARHPHLARAWRLARALPRWERRGESAPGVSLSPEHCARCVRCTPADGTNGFFVALFVRRRRGARLRLSASRLESLAKSTRASSYIQRLRRTRQHAKVRYRVWLSRGP